MSLHCKKVGDWDQSSTFGTYLHSDFNNNDTLILDRSLPVAGKELGIKTNLLGKWAVTATGKLDTFFYLVAAGPSSAVKVSANNVAVTSAGNSWVLTIPNDKNQNENHAAFNCQVTVTNANLIPDLQVSAPSKPIEVEVK